MPRQLIALLIGLVVGGGAVYAISTSKDDDQAAPVVRDLAVVTRMSVDDAEQHREELFANIQSIEDVLALPSRFRQTEALHVLAGRGDSATVQGLIFEANRIVDDEQRRSTLTVLFARLTEIDAESALALVRTDYFRGQKYLEQAVWGALGRLDLDAALTLARNQATHRERSLAAQSLYAAFGYMGNSTTNRIEAELGIAPDRTTRTRYLHRLADRSPEEAIAMINALPALQAQSAMANALAVYLAGLVPEQAIGYADLFEAAQTGQSYRSTLLTNLARNHPVQILDRLVAGDRSGLRPEQVYAALGAIAESDFELALEYHDRLSSQRDKQILGGAIAAVLAKRDVDEALAWARANDTGAFPTQTMRVIHEIAQHDPQRALDIALAEEKPRERQVMLQSVFQALAQRDPQQALSYLDQLSPGERRTEATQQLVSMWVQLQPDAAVDWILSQNDDVRERYMSRSVRTLIQTDIDAAIRLLDRMPAEQSEGLRNQVVRQLAERGSVDEARRYLRRFEGQDGYDMLKASMISGVAQADPVAAQQLIGELPAGQARDSAMAEIIQQGAVRNPAEAATWLASINDNSRRTQATNSVILHWARQDAPAATRWVNQMQRGLDRDTAILALARNWKDVGPTEQALIDSMASPGMRSQINMQRIIGVMRTDPRRAVELVDELELTDEQRQQAEQWIERVRYRM